LQSVLSLHAYSNNFFTPYIRRVTIQQDTPTNYRTTKEQINKVQRRSNEKSEANIQIRDTGRGRERKKEREKEGEKRQTGRERQREREKERERERERKKEKKDRQAET